MDGQHALESYEPRVTSLTFRPHSARIAAA